MVWRAVITGAVLSITSVIFYLRGSRANLSNHQWDRRSARMINGLLFLTGLGGIIIGLGVFEQYILLNKTVAAVSMLAYFAALILMVIKQKKSSG